MEFCRITLWRIFLYLEDIAILGDLATLWSLDYDALVLVDVLEDRCYTWRCLLLLGDLGVFYFGGAWRLVVHGCFAILVDDMEAWSMRS